jgi:IstB-like ATP binding protein
MRAQPPRDGEDVALEVTDEQVLPARQDAPEPRRQRGETAGPRVDREEQRDVARAHGFRCRRARGPSASARAPRCAALRCRPGRAHPLDFLDAILRRRSGPKQRRRMAMGITIAHFPVVKTLDDFDFKFRPSVDQKLVREARGGPLRRQPENVLILVRPEWARRTSSLGSAASPSRPARASHQRDRAAGCPLEGGDGGSTRRPARLLCETRVPHRGRARVPAVREAQRAPLLPSRRDRGTRRGR